MKIILLISLLFLLNNCVEIISISSGLVAGKPVQTGVKFVASKTIEKKTGKTPVQHVFTALAPSKEPEVKHTKLETVKKATTTVLRHALIIEKGSSAEKIFKKVAKTVVKDNSKVLIAKFLKQERVPFKTLSPLEIFQKTKRFEYKEFKQAQAIKYQKFKNNQR
jgi:hypothetical protein